MLGRYELLTLLSVGGMAEIYLARSEGIAGFEKLVVVKRILPHLSMQRDFVEMFLAEARLAAMLDHPNIVQVHDIGEDTGNYYYAMELVRGADLRQVMKAQAQAKGAVPLHCAIAIGLGMCAGLEHAHELKDHLGEPLGVVHRDVSLSNVMVSYDGTVKITDFGVAKLTSGDARTRTGTLKGKIGYMSPEQCRGEALDRRSDIFAIGIILYELTTGRRLFRPEGSEFAILQRIIRDDAEPPTTFRADCPSGLEAIILSALQRDRRLRYQTAKEMQRDLEALAREERLPASPIELAEYVRGLVPAKPIAGEHTGSRRTRARIEVPSGLWSASTLDDDLVIPVEDTVHGDLPKTPGNGTLAVPPLPATPEPMARPPIAARLLAGIASDRRRVALALVGSAIAGILIAVAGVVAFRGDGDRVAAAHRAAARPALATRPAAAAPPVATASIAAPVAASRRELEAPPADPAPRALGDEPPTAATPVATDMPTRATSPARVAARDRADDERRPVKVAARTPPRPARVASEASPAPDATEPAARDAEPAVPAPPDAGTRAADPPPEVAAPPPRATPPPPPRTTDPGPMDAVPSIATVDVTGPIQDSEIRRGLGRVVGAFRACYRDAARAARKSPSAKVRLSFQIDETRAARNIHAAGAPLPGLGTCLENAAGAIRTRIAPDVGNAQVKVTITFDPGGS